MMTPEIEQRSPTKLIGKSTTMSFADDRTHELWQSFMPHRKAVEYVDGPELYSVQIFPDTTFFEQFDPNRIFEKWAAIPVTDFATVPDALETLIIPAGLYAVFYYWGRPSEATATFRYIYSTWIPQSEYELDDRPHFALMGEGYKGEDPESEETFWIPIRKP